VEVIKLDIKIVGSITDEKALDEIQSIAKIFVYERRMKNLNFQLQERNNKNINSKIKKTDNCRKYPRNLLYNKLVKGLI
jgi:hypothetical protein